MSVVESLTSDATDFHLDVALIKGLFLGRNADTMGTPALDLSPEEYFALERNATHGRSTSLDELITELERISQHAPTITITLVAPAPAEVKKTLVAWCRQSLHPDMLVSLRFNATILGGMVVRSRSQIYDWSWKRSIMNNRHRFAEVLNRV